MLNSFIHDENLVLLLILESSMSMLPMREAEAVVARRMAYFTNKEQKKKVHLIRFVKMVL